MRFLVFFLLILFTIQIKGQDIRISIFCLNENGENLTNVKLKVVGGNYSKTTFGFSIFAIDSLVNIEASCKNYESIIKTIHVKNYLLSGNQDISLRFELKTRNLDTAIVQGAKPVIIFGSEQESVHDFEFDKNGNLIFITYPKLEKKNRTFKIMKNDSVLGSSILAESVDKLFRDFRGNVHAVCDEHVFQLYLKNDSLKKNQIDRNYFKLYVAPIIDSNNRKKYLSNYSPNYPAFEYYVFDELDSTYGRIVGLQDSFMMEMYRAEYRFSPVRIKLWAKDMENQTGIDKEIWVGSNYFTSSLYYKEIYAPMFSTEQSLIVLDYANNNMMTFDKKGRKLDATKIAHGQNESKSGWCRNVLQDDITKEIYVAYERDGFTSLRNLNTTTGLLGRERKLKFKYIGKLRIHNGKAHYIYRPYESIQKKFLYAELF